MSTKQNLLESKGIAQLLPAAGNAGKKTRSSIKWNGRKISLISERGIWRMRCRSKILNVDVLLSRDLTASKIEAREHLQKNSPGQQFRLTGTAADVIRVYTEIPKPVNARSERNNVNCLTQMIREVSGKPPEEFKTKDIPGLFMAYPAIRQGLTKPDFSTRRRENITVNSTMCQAASLFAKALYPEYQRAGIILPDGIASYKRLPVTQLIPADADEAGLMKAWTALRHENLNLWLAVGLAYFAGLRKSEAIGCRGSWLVRRNEMPAILVMDRDDEKGRPDFRTKTGIMRYAWILNADLAAYLESIPKEKKAERVIGDMQQTWFDRHVQEWLRPFTGEAKKPYHRLRGLYADRIKREQEDAFLARRAGVKAASEALGHTNTTTTEDHYLDPRQNRI